MSVEDFREILRNEATKTVDHRSLNSRSEINNGWCGEFARSVSDTIRSEFGDEYLIWSRDGDMPTVHKHSYGGESVVDASHIWLEYKSRHFDAECIEGVANPVSLPIFDRNGVKNLNE